MIQKSAGLIRRIYMRVRPLLPLMALFSGVALLLYIIAGVDLRLGLAVTTAGVVVGLTAWLQLSTPAERRWIARTIAIGALSGFLATMAYDVAKSLLSLLDPSPYDPFHAIRVFGELLVGSDAAEPLIVVMGAGFHFLNGSMFGVAYTFLFARDGRTTVRRALVTGVIWGIFLETFQLTLYPGWLDVRFYQEFVTISALGHVVYGAILGLLSRTLLQLLSPAEGSG